MLCKLFVCTITGVSIFTIYNASLPREVLCKRSAVLMVRKGRSASQITMIGRRSLFAQQQKNIGFKFTYMPPHGLCVGSWLRTRCYVSSLAAAKRCCWHRHSESVSRRIKPKVSLSISIKKTHPT